MERFKAATQYGDWKGTASADDMHESIRDYLRKEGLLKDEEFLIALSFYSGEHDFNFIRAYVFEKGFEYEKVKDALDAMKGPIPVREVSVKLTNEKFFELFKRFSVVLTWHGSWDGREYSVIGE